MKVPFGRAYMYDNLNLTTLHVNIFDLGNHACTCIIQERTDRWEMLLFQVLHTVAKKARHRTHAVVTQTSLDQHLYLV